MRVRATGRSDLSSFFLHRLRAAAGAVGTLFRLGTPGLAADYSHSGSLPLQCKAAVHCLSASRAEGSLTLTEGCQFGYSCAKRREGAYYAIATTFACHPVSLVTLALKRSIATPCSGPSKRSIATAC